MKEKYSELELMIIEVDEEDVVSTSGTLTWDDADEEFPGEE